MTGKDNEMYPGVAYCSIPSGFTTPSSAHVHVHYCNQALVAKARWALETLKEHQMVLIQLSWYMHHTNSPTSSHFCINHYRNYKSIICVRHRCRCHRSSRQCIDQYRYQSQSQCLCRYQSFENRSMWSSQIFQCHEIQSQAAWRVLKEPPGTCGIGSKLKLVVYIANWGKLTRVLQSELKLDSQDQEMVAEILE